MKKLGKTILVGAGIAAVGLLVYSLRKDAEKPASVWSSDAEPATSPSKEYVEHRRQQIRDAEAKKAAQEENARKEAAQGETAQEEAIQGEPPDTVPVESAFTGQVVEQQGEL